MIESWRRGESGVMLFLEAVRLFFTHDAEGVDYRHCQLLLHNLMEDYNY